MMSLAPISLRQLTAFLAVAELGTFTKAAERLRMAQSPLSQLVRGLESELGIALFDRTTRRVELTEAGREFRLAASRIVADLDLAVRGARDLAERRRGRVVVAAPPLLAAVLLPAAVAELRAVHPGIQVTLLDVRTETVVDMVRLGQADCGVGTFPSLDDGVERLPLTRDSLMVFCLADDPLAARRAVAWAGLADRPLIALTRESGIRRLTEVGYEAAGIGLQPAYEVAQITTALALVEAGLGLAVLPTYARAVSGHRRLVARPLTSPSIARDVVLIRAAERTRTPAALAFEEVLRRCVRRVAPDDSD